MSSLNTYAFASTGVLGERTNWIQCYDARDTHFDCLDQFNDKTDNHYKCEKSYNSWKRFCNGGIRRVQIDERNQMKQDQQLYTAEYLQQYNKLKNERTWDKPNTFSIVQ